MGVNAISKPVKILILHLKCSLTNYLSVKYAHHILEANIRVYCFKSYLITEYIIVLIIMLYFNIYVC